MKCKNCGAELEPNSAFCTNCGSPVTNETELCPRCGEPLEEGSAFCTNCGAPIGGHEPPMREMPPLPRKTRKPEKSGGKGHGALIGVLSGVIVLLLAAVAAIVLNVMGIIDIDGIFNGGQQPTEMTEASPEPTDIYDGAIMPKDSEKPKATPTTAPKATTTPKTEHTYRVVIDHVTWNAARDAAVRAGGHLVTFNSREEFDKVVSMLSGYSSVKNVWIGACAPVGLTSASAAANYWNSQDAAWITGEPFTFAKWRSGEPSGYDAGLGTEERYIQIFKPKADGGEWSYNDAGDDLSEYKPDTLAYVIEFE